MKKVTVYTFSLLFCLFVLGQTSFAQLRMPQPSPTSKISQKVGLMDATIEYSRPGVKGRTVFGDLVPYDAMWRTGANSPTKITFSDKVTIEGTEISKGAYTLITMPGKTEWTFILNKDSNGRGVFDYKESEDVLRFKAKSRPLSEMVETFTMNFTDIKSNEASIEISWEKTAVKFSFQTEVDDKVMAQINQILDPKPSANTKFQIASYFYNNNRNMEQALQLITESTDEAPRYWTMHLKAKIQAKLKDKDGALTSAKKSLSLAKESENPDYVRLNEKLINELNQ